MHTKTVDRWVTDCSNLDVSHVFACAFDEPIGVGQFCAVIETEVHVVALVGDIDPHATVFDKSRIAPLQRFIDTRLSVQYEGPQQARQSHMVFADTCQPLREVLRFRHGRDL